MSTKDARWLWLIVAEPDLLSLRRVPGDGCNVPGAGDMQKSAIIVLCISRCVVCESICELCGVHSGFNSVFPLI